MNVRCPKCVELSSHDEWNKRTAKVVTGTEDTSSVASVLGGTVDSFHICPKCDKQSSINNLEVLL